MAHLLAVVQRNDYLARVMLGEGGGRIGGGINAAGERENRAVADRLVFQFVERESPSQQSRRNDVGDGELRIVTIGRRALVLYRLAHGLDDFSRHQNLD